MKQVTTIFDESVLADKEIESYLVAVHKIVEAKMDKINELHNEFMSAEDRSQKEIDALGESLKLIMSLAPLEEFIKNYVVYGERIKKQRDNIIQAAKLHPGIEVEIHDHSEDKVN